MMKNKISYLILTFANLLVLKASKIIHFITLIGFLVRGKVKMSYKDFSELIFVLNI